MALREILANAVAVCLTPASGDGAAKRREAVAQQKTVWSSCHRLLAAVGDEDPRVRALLDSAAAK